MLRLLLMLAFLAAVPAVAGTVLLGFEKETDKALFHDEGRTTNNNFPVTLERRWATAGEYSLCLRTPQWKTGMGEWPAVELAPPLTDWSGYDRLVLDLTNPTAFEHKFIFFISDSKIATRGGLQIAVDLPRSGYTQVVVDLTKLAGPGVNPRDIHVIHFFTQRPEGDMEVYLDNVVLLKPGEPLPVPQSSFIKALAALQKDQVAALREFQQQARARLLALAAKTPSVKTFAEKGLVENDRRVATFAAQVEQGDPAALRSAELIAELRLETARLESLVRLRAGFEAIRSSVQTGLKARSDILVGFASSMQKVLPRAGVPDLRTERRVSLALARNEKEAMQVVVMPVEAVAKQVSVRVADLRTSNGAVFAGKNIDTPPMGYVETKSRPPYGTSHIGWWPDPILDFMRTADIAQGDAQSFWVRFRAPKGQTPGTYRGKLEVLVAGKPLYAFDLAVEVYPFTLPDRSPLNMAITFGPHDLPLPSTEKQQAQWRKSPDYAINIWKRHRVQWGDFLADYYITYDSLYHHGLLDWEIIQRLHEQGRLAMFNLGYYPIMPDKPEEAQKWKDNIAGYIGKNYERAKELGLLDHAYIYGCDEHPADMFPAVERAAAYLKKTYPGVLILTTTYDHSFGTDSVLQSMDGFCPLTPSYKRDLADRVRATGKQVWWYICCGPHHPFANMFVEYPAIDGRVLMGAQTVKQRPDGFLYYQISIWNCPQPITGGPFTDWDPRSWTTYHGDGSWTCVGPDGTPLPTIRLENFRDGIEDYAYAMLLEEAIKKAQANVNPTAAQQEWLKRAQAALEVPLSVTRTMTDFTQDPADVYRWRRGMAEALGELYAR